MRQRDGHAQSLLNPWLCIGEGLAPARYSSKEPLQLPKKDLNPKRPLTERALIVT